MMSILQVSELDLFIEYSQKLWSDFLSQNESHQFLEDGLVPEHILTVVPRYNIFIVIRIEIYLLTIDFFWQNLFPP